VRAAEGGLVPSEKGGYSSGITFTNSPSGGKDFVSTFVFDDPEAARITAGTGVERVLAWQVEDAQANRQGLTISEFCESGGPGFGGCPAGPGEQSAPRARTPPCGTATRPRWRSTGRRPPRSRVPRP
jgi:hypothetical protein